MANIFAFSFLKWRRLTASERDIFEEKARERAREQEVYRQEMTASHLLLSLSLSRAIYK